MENSEKELKGMLVFHSAYTFEFIKRQGLEVFVESRDASAFFDRIFTVNPIANLQYRKDSPKNFTSPEMYFLDERNQILEGKVSRYAFLEKFPVLNFFLAQFALLFSIFKYGNLLETKLIRAEDPRLNGMYGLFFAKLLRKPLIVGVWGNPGRLRELNQKPNMPRLFPTLKSEAMVERFILKRADAVLAQNQENLNYALESGVHKTKTFLTPLGVGMDKHHFLDPELRKEKFANVYTWSLNQSLLLSCVSRLESLKMVDHAIKATSYLKNANIDFKLIIIGDGRERQNLERLVSNEGLIQNVIFAGNQSQEWISGALSFIDINVSPLCGRSLLEAGLAGLPTVAYDVDWHNEIVLPGKTGLLAPNLNIEAMGLALLELGTNPKLRNDMSVAMRERAMEISSPEKIALIQREIYKSFTSS